MFSQARTDDRDAELRVESLQGIGVTGCGDLLDLADVAVEANTRVMRLITLHARSASALVNECGTPGWAVPKSPGPSSTMSSPS